MIKLFYRSKSEDLDIQTIDAIDIEQESDTPKPVKKRGRRPKIKEESLGLPSSSGGIVHDEINDKISEKQKCSSVENLIEMLENEDKDVESEETSNIMKEDISQKMIQPSDIKQEAIHPEINDDRDDDDDDDLEDSTMFDEDDDSDYDGNDDSKNDGGDSNSPKKSKVSKNSVKKKAPEILIPQMVSIDRHFNKYLQ